VNVGPGTRREAFRWEENAWWSPGLASEDLRLPGEMVGAQVVVDPALDASLRPTNAAAAEFGAVR
jgi:hypothetical protein